MENLDCLILCAIYSSKCKGNGVMYIITSFFRCISPMCTPCNCSNAKVALLCAQINLQCAKSICFCALLVQCVHLRFVINKLLCIHRLVLIQVVTSKMYFIMCKMYFILCSICSPCTIIYLLSH